MKFIKTVLRGIDWCIVKLSYIITEMLFILMDSIDEALWPQQRR